MFRSELNSIRWRFPSTEDDVGFSAVSKFANTVDPSCNKSWIDLFWDERYKINASFVRTDEFYYLTFDTQKDKLVFLLKWSS
jgi:hypothetical protein